MKARIQKWGNSLGVRLPVQPIKKLKLFQGCPVILDSEDRRIITQPLKYDLDTMLDEITTKNQHHITNDNSQGKEEW